MEQNTVRLIILIYFYIVVCGNIFMNKLDRKTRCKGDNIISGKWGWYFFIFNWMCYFFIDKIKEKRKIEYMERRVKMYEIMQNTWNLDGDILTQEEKSELRNINIYLKINKLRKKNGIN